MLLYAWNYPQEKDFIHVTNEDEKDILNIFSKVLIKKVNSLIKRGFYKEYVEIEDELSIVRGKILFKQSLDRFSYKRGKMHVLEEEMTHDILHNQIIKTTMFHLANKDSLLDEYREEINRILMYFNRISVLEMSSTLFKRIRLHRNNEHYRFLLSICQFIWEHKLLHEDEGSRQFQDFNREHQQLARLFENFVKNFYRKEIAQSRVRSESLHWPAEGDEVAYLPRMLTDISLEYDDQKFIIDTKFYKDIFGIHWEKESIQSDHLYQLFAYLKNDEYYSGKKATGILLYPKVHKSVDLKFNIHGFPIKICTVDLNSEWQNIHNRLLQIVTKNNK